MTSIRTSGLTEDFGDLRAVDNIKDDHAAPTCSINRTDQT